MDTQDIIVLVIPIIIVQLALQIGAFVNLMKRDASQVRWNNKLVWIFIILLGEMIGAIFYFVFGRVEGEPDVGSGG